MKHLVNEAPAGARRQRRFVFRHLFETEHFACKEFEWAVLITLECAQRIGGLRVRVRSAAIALIVSGRSVDA